MATRVFDFSLGLGLHDKNTLQAGDFYGRKYGQYTFYTDANAIDDLNQRIIHVLDVHENKLFGNRPWICFQSNSSTLNIIRPIPMIFDQTFYVAIHDYNDHYDNFMSNAISQAKASGKKLIIEEWGSLFSNGRTANLPSNTQKINNYKVRWIYCNSLPMQILTKGRTSTRQALVSHVVEAVISLQLFLDPGQRS